MSEIFTIESSSLPSATRVAAYEGRERLSETSSYKVWLLVPASAAESVDPEAVVLATARFAMHRDDGSLRRQVHGVFASIELLDETAGGDALYVADLVPTAWKLKLSRHSRVWVDKTLREIVRDVFTKAGLDGSHYEDRLTGTYAPIPHVCQYRESDYDFVARWFEREGIYFTFEHSDSGDKLVYLDHKARQVDADDPVVRFRMETGGGSSGGEGARYFQASRAARSARVELTDHDPQRPTSVPRGRADVDPRGDGELRRHLEDHFTDDAQGRRLANLRAEAERAERELLRLEGRIYGVAPGQNFELAEHPRAAHNQEYQCVGLDTWGRLFTGAEEFARWLPTYRERDRHTEWTVLAMTPIDVQYRPRMQTPRPRVAGVTVGHVDGPVGSDYAQLDDHGRYLVRVHFDENEGPDGTHSTRVRMAQPHAGAPEGWHLPLRKGTEVLLTFVGGDPDRPVIAATIPNADTLSPVTEMNHTQNVLHTGSDNRVEMEDTAGGQYIDISTPPQNTFIHLGAHHGPHAYNYITSTDGDGLIRTGGDYNVTVGGQKYEHVHGTVTEDYDQTKRTEVTLAVDEKYHVNHCVSVTSHCQENYHATQTTEVATHTEEKCASQETHVRAALSEQHGSQTTNVVGDWTTRCDNELWQTGASTQRDGTLHWTIRDGALIKAASVTIRGPSYRMTSRTTRTINRPDEMMADATQHHLAGNKFEAGLMALKFNGIAISNIAVKIDFLTGLAMEASMIKAEDTGIKMSTGNTATEFLGSETVITPLEWTCIGLGVLV
jgi:type VI secretion system secreted protein VgrG